MRCLARGPSCTEPGRVDGGDQRLWCVSDRGRELEPVKALMLALAAVTHLGIHRRDDPVGPCAAMQPGDGVVVDVEVLADQLAQQPPRLAD